MIGEWVYIPNRTFNAPVCCSWDGEYKELLKSKCGSKTTFRKWHYRGPAFNDFPVQTGGNACSRNFVDNYVWKPSPAILDFNPQYVCELLRNRTVLVLGDSTGQQTASILMNALQAGKCAPQIVFILSDTLVHREGDRGPHWYKAFVQQKPDICIFSVGAHLRGEGAEDFITIFDEVVAKMIAIQQQQREEHLASVTQFVYRSQQPGGCTEGMNVYRDPDSAGMAVNETYSLYKAQHNLKNRYNYHTFYDRDMYALSRLQEVGMPVIDLRMLYVRSDSHAFPPLDCLHFAFPGPLDVIPTLFQDLLHRKVL